MIKRLARVFIKYFIFEISDSNKQESKELDDADV